ncbi:transglutaminase family protein, partial [Burkholderia pseudomallei]
SYIDSIDRAPAGSVDVLVALKRRLQHDFRYVVRLEPGVQTPVQTLALASGSCGVRGGLLVQLCRHLGVGARCVSGY